MSGALIDARMSSVMIEFGPEVIASLRAVLLEHEFIMGDQLGRGGFSVVYHVKTVRHQQEFAAKITNMTSTRHTTAKTAVINEEHALRKLKHPYVVQLYQSFHHENYSFLILELCTGRSLKHRISESGGRPLSNSITIMAGICEGLQFVHSHHHVHRDIKLGNILFDSSGNPKVADFGMCVPCAENEIFSDFPGSLNYCAPEILNHRPYDPYKSDVWSLGVTFIEIMTGPLKYPKGQNSLAESIVDHGIAIPPQIPTVVAKLIGRMTDMNPEKRPTLAEVRNCALFVHIPACRIHSERGNRKQHEKSASKPRRSQKALPIRPIEGTTAGPIEISHNGLSRTCDIPLAPIAQNLVLSRTQPLGCP
jgi:serine/threonine protein kinase